MTFARIALGMAAALAACAAPAARHDDPVGSAASARDATGTRSATADASATPTADASATPTAGPTDPFACRTAEDCLNSCRHGAVNRAWWQASYPGDEGCEDGCASKGAEPPRCEGGSCVAYRQAERDDGCTRRETPVVEGPGPAHRCSADSDCMVSCRYGAVNEAWYAWGAKDECKDGCAEYAPEARCEAGACVAYAHGARVAGCTRRSIFER